MTTAPSLAEEDGKIDSAVLPVSAAAENAAHASGSSGFRERNSDFFVFTTERQADTNIVNSGPVSWIHPQIYKAFDG